MWQRIRQSPDWRYVALTLPVMALMQAIGSEHFRYIGDAVQAGEVWRIVTAHWVHVNWKHLMLNALSLVVLVSLTTPGWTIRRWLLQTVIIAVGISVLLALFNPEVLDYAGHSGVLYGLYLLGAIALYPRDRLVASLIVVIVSGRVVVEKLEIFDLGTDDFIGARVILDAHMYGLLMAIAIALVWSIYTYTMNHGPTEQSN